MQSRTILRDLEAAGIGFAASVPCKQLAGVIAGLAASPRIRHLPATREDEGMGLCAGAYLGGLRPVMVMQNTGLGVCVNVLATLIQFYRLPLPMLISYRGEVGEAVACQAEMAVHTKPLLAQLHVPTYHFHHPRDVAELPGILAHAFTISKPVAVLMDAGFWKGDRP